MEIKKDDFLNIAITITLFAGLAFFALSYNILQNYNHDKAVHEDWCPRTVYGNYDPANETNGMEDKNVSAFKEFKNLSEVRNFCQHIFPGEYQ